MIRRIIGWAPLAVLGAFAVAGIVGPVVTAGRERLTDLSRALESPSASALLGTDELGRDQMMRLLAGARGSLVAVVIVLVSCLVIGVGLGVLAGWRGGLLDRVALRLVDVVTALPVVLVGLVLATLLGGSSLNVALALAATTWPPYVRLIRTETSIRRDLASNQALVLLGAGAPRILLRHILPSLLGPVSVLLGITAAEVVLAVATLSYLGVGAQPPAPEWGSMLVASQPYLEAAPWLFLAPAVAVTSVAVACTVLADRSAQWFTHGVRAPAPRRRGERSAPAAPAPAGPGLRVRDLAIDIDGVPVVHGVSFDVPPGGTLAIVGSSGSGKTMTMLGVLGLFPATVQPTVRGSAALDGVPLTGPGAAAVRGKTAAYLPQDLGGALDPLRRVGSQIAAVARLHLDLSRAQAAARAVELLGAVGIADPARVSRQRPGELSGGMRQRVLLACALAGEPTLLIADEPTSALDASAAMQMVELLDRTRRERGLSLVIITHELAVARRLASHVAVFDGGRIVEAGPIDAAISSPAHEATARLVTAALPTCDPRSAPGGGDLLVARGLRVAHPARGRRPEVLALRGADMRIAEGQVLGIVGDSGSGKSSLARALAGLERRATGSVLLRGTPVQATDGRIQLVFQDPMAALDRRQTIGAALVEAGRIVGRPVDPLAALARVGMGAQHAARRPWQLSGGERQRAVIARAMVGEPDLLILDEPVSALDSVHRVEVVALLRDLRDAGQAMILISHDLAVVEHLADMVLVVDGGSLVGRIDPDGAVAGDAHPAVRRLAAARDYFTLAHQHGAPTGGAV